MSLLLLTVLLAADARPTAGDVATAVQFSRERSAEKRDPLARSHALSEASLKREITSAERSLLDAQQIADGELRLAESKRAADEVSRLRGQLSSVLTKKTEDAAKQDLDDIDISGLTVGVVGQLRCCQDQTSFKARCERILGPDKSIVTITRYRVIAAKTAGPIPGSTVIEHRLVPKVQATVVLKGYSTNGLREGQEIRDLTVNLVVVGREVLGRTLPLVEVFEPEKPFK